jgi:imidazolonepropionase-like amidohydrolase
MRAFFPLASVLVAAVLPAAIAGALRPTKPTALPPLAITHVTVIPMDGAHTLADQTVLVRDGRIAAVGAATSVSIPKGASAVDGRGAYLIPGLVDAHFHYIAQDPIDDPYSEDISSQFSMLLVAAGVTTVLDLCGSPWTMALRERIASGEILGPRIFTSPDCLGDPDMTGPQGTIAVSNAKAVGYDFLKVYSFLSKVAFDSIAAAARRLGMPVIGHIPLSVGLQPMLDAGAVGVAHAEEFLYNPPFNLHYHEPDSLVKLDPANIPTVAHAMHRAGAAVSPTLITYTTILDEGANLASVLARPELRVVSPQARASRGWNAEQNDRAARLADSVAQARLKMGLAFQRRLVRAFEDSGVTILAGTDAGASIPLAPGVSLHEELQALVTAGLTPYESLRAGTANAGEWLTRYFHAGPNGVVREGARADLLLLDANPLTNIGNTRKIRGVVLRGKWLPRRELDRWMTEMVTGYTRP